MKDLNTLILLIIVALIAYAFGQARADPIVTVSAVTAAPAIIQDQPPVIIVPVTPIPPLNQHTPLSIEATWTPFYVAPTNPPLPTDIPARGGFEAPTPAGDIGVHNPGRTDQRSP